MSPGGDLESLSDGLAEELLNLLARVQELRVISRTSAFSYKSRDVRIADVASELRVGHVLEGSVRQSGRRLRITVQLIDATTDSHLWSETYDRLLDDIFAVQDDIARQVVQKLRLTLFEPLPETRQIDPEAYALYLQANHLRKQSTPESFEQAVAMYRRALDLQPDFVAAWDGLALIYCMQANFGLLPAEKGYALCRESTEKALALDPDFAPSLSGMAWIAMQRDGDFAKAADYYRRALALAPGNVSIIGDAATLLQFMGRLDEAIALSEYASARDPVNPIGFANLGTTYRVAGRLDDAIAAFRTAISLSPDRIGAYFQLGVALLRSGAPAEALAVFKQEQSEDWQVMGVALAHHALGDQEAFEAAFTALRDGWGERWPTEVAQVYAWIGESDEAFAWLDKALTTQGNGSWPDIRVDDLLAPLHMDARWPVYADSLGIPQAMLDEIDFTITLPNRKDN
jgi:TolB-like protein/cytochrome c-type biogenesis protein CcmH/NrfG